MVQSPSTAPRRISTALVVGSCLIVLAAVLAALMILFR
jgi:hypothetical protein